MLTLEQISWGPLAAAALLVTLPVLLVTVIAQTRSQQVCLPAV
jgi:multiple sugar transport system permease protein